MFVWHNEGQRKTRPLWLRSISRMSTTCASIRTSFWPTRSLVNKRRIFNTVRDMHPFILPRCPQPLIPVMGIQVDWEIYRAIAKEISQEICGRKFWAMKEDIRADPNSA